MRAVLWLSVLCGIALATPARHRRGDGEQPKQQTAELQGTALLEAILQRPPLSVLVYKETMSNLSKKVEFAEEHMRDYLEKSAADFTNMTQEKFKGLAIKWQNMKSRVLGTFDSVAFDLVLTSYYLYAGHTEGFYETRRCDHLRELVRAEGRKPTMKNLVKGIRKTTICFIDVLKEASKPGKIDCDSITEKRAMGLTIHEVQTLHPLKLNGARASKTAEQIFNMIMEADKSKQENQGSSPGNQGGQVTPNKRIVQLLRRYLEMKRGHGGHGGSKSDGDKGHGNSGPGGAYPCEVFSKNIKDVIQIVLKNVDRFSKIVDDMKQKGLTDDKLRELKTKWQNEVQLAGSDTDLAMTHLEQITQRLYLNNDTSEFKEVNICELKTVTFSGTITDENDEKQIKAFTDALVETVRDDAICIQEHIDEEAKLRSRLDDFCDNVPEDEAMRLIQDLFKHLHQVRMTIARFFQYIERASYPLVKVYMPATKRRELREMESELTQLMKKDLAADS